VRTPYRKRGKNGGKKAPSPNRKPTHSIGEEKNRRLLLLLTDVKDSSFASGAEGKSPKIRGGMRRNH